MNNDSKNAASAQAAAQATERVIKLEEEVEASGTASLDDAAVAFARAVLHQWVDTVTAVVTSPGLGRVTLIHADGRKSSIASPDLPFRLSPPVGAKQADQGEA
jgi:hypothetical protein